MAVGATNARARRAARLGGAGEVGTLEPEGTRVTEDGSTTRCRQCRKPIVWPGLCYTCATGLPRQLRPREDGAQPAPTHQAARSDQTRAPG
jgi:hypothetical protein